MKDLKETLQTLQSRYGRIELETFLTNHLKQMRKDQEVERIYEMHPDIAYKIESLEESQEVLRTMSSTYYALIQMADDMDEKCGAWVYASHVSIGFCFHILNGVDDVLPILKQLAQNGWHLTDGMKRQPAYSELQWQLSHTDYEFIVRVDAHVKDDDDSLDTNVCRRVIIGMETQETPIYDIVCPDSKGDTL